MIAKTKMILLFLTLLILGISAFLLYLNYPFKEIVIDNKLKELRSNELFDLVSLNEKDNWDLMYIQKPYDPRMLKEEGVIMSDECRQIVESLSSFDSHCVLVFTKDKRLVNYAVVSFAVADFSKLSKNKYPRSSKMKSILVWNGGENQTVWIQEP